MNLPKAIEILSDCLNVGTEEATPDVNDALRLGIEAIKRLLLARSYGDKHTLQRLQGEDE